jgi:tetratricopeptide (TPR) repeat protein
VRHPRIWAVAVLGSIACVMLARPVLAEKMSDAKICEKASGDEAIAACTRAIATDRGHGLAVDYNNRGVEYLHKADNDRAIADYSEAARIDPHYGQPHKNLGEIYRARGDFDHALPEFTEAIRIDPKDSEAYNYRARAYIEKGDLDHAIADASDAIRIWPKYAGAYNNRALAYSEKGDYDRAIAEYDEAIKLVPTYATGYSNRGLSYMNKNDFEHAIADFGEAIRNDPKFVLAYNNRASAYLTDFDHALADYDEAIRLDPKSSSLFRNRGIVEMYAGKLPKALIDLNQSSELGPKDAHNALWLDIANRRSNLPSRLDDATRQVDMTRWPAAIIRLYLGQLTQDAVFAAADDRDSVTKRAQLCEANFYVGQWALQRNDKDLATRLFRLAADSCPVTNAAWYAAKVEMKMAGSQ